VVEADDRGPQAALEDAADRLEAGGDRRDLEAAEDPDRRRRGDPQPGRGDDPERALAADEELGEVGAAAGARHAADVDDLAAAGDDGQAEDAILDLAVLGRQLAGRPAREPAADRRAVDRRREVPGGEPAA